MPAPMSICFLTVNPLRGAICPYVFSGSSTAIPIGMHSRVAGGIVTLVVAWRSKLIAPGVARWGVTALGHSVRTCRRDTLLGKHLPSQSSDHWLISQLFQSNCTP